MYMKTKLFKLEIIKTTPDASRYNMRLRCDLSCSTFYFFIVIHYFFVKPVSCKFCYTEQINILFFLRGQQVSRIDII